jgi:hypothetical protein
MWCRCVSSSFKCCCPRMTSEHSGSNVPPVINSCPDYLAWTFDPKQDQSTRRSYVSCRDRYDDHVTGFPLTDSLTSVREISVALPDEWPRRVPHHEAFGPVLPLCEHDICRYVALILILILTYAYHYPYGVPLTLT